MAQRRLVFLPIGLLVIGVSLNSTPATLAEELTMSTNYPAPRGIYDQLVTMGSTYLARAGGAVGIGTRRPLGALT